MKNGGRGWEGIPPVADVLFQFDFTKETHTRVRWRNWPFLETYASMDETNW